MDKNQAVEELAYIRKIIDQSRASLMDNGFGYIMWGVVVVIGLMSTYIGILNKFYFPYQVNWIVLVLTGWTISFFWYRKERKKSRTYSYADKIVSSIWIGIGVCISIIGFLGITSGATHGAFISAFIAAPLGAAYYASGVVYDYRWLQLMSVGWWAGSIVMFLFPGLYVLPLMAGMLICFQIVPGLVIYKKFKSSRVDNND